MFPEPTHEPDSYITCEQAIGDLPSRSDELGLEEDDYRKIPTSEYQKKMREGPVINEPCGHTTHRPR